MSYTKIAFENMSNAVNKIQKDTIHDNDFTNILKYLNVMIEVKESITLKNDSIGQLWNEIIYDILSSIHSASCGFYRSAIVVLRSILELGCNSFFYYDHIIEYTIYQNENIKADKYVSTLVNDYDFFKTKYIKAFFCNIEQKQDKEDSVSDYLKSLYGTLSDIVHGRYKSLIKSNGLEVKYEKDYFKRYESLFFRTLSILAVMYILRIENTSNPDLSELANYIKVVEL